MSGVCGHGCGAHAVKESYAPMGMLIAIGFGSAYVLRNGKELVDGEHPILPTTGLIGANARERRWRRARMMMDKRGYVTLRLVERFACKHRGRYEAVICGPLWDARWERRRPGKWLCVERGRGFEV